LTKELFSQAGVLPFRVNGAGELEILLIRRVEKDKWGIPKGVVSPGRSLEDTARDEAAEEAGVAGELSVQPVGYYSFKKWGGICHVTIFLMRVAEVHDRYPEQDRRQRQWFSPAAAAEAARRKKIRSLITELPRLIKEQNM